jgi:glutathione S-transferase
MKLYVCWTTIQTLRPGGHPCHNAYAALQLAGHDPEVVKVRGLGIGPRFMQWMTEGRREVEELSGQRAVPVLVTDDGEVVSDSKRIVEWAEAHPAQPTGAGAGSASGSSAGGASDSGTGSASGS